MANKRARKTLTPERYNDFQAIKEGRHNFRMEDPKHITDEYLKKVAGHGLDAYNKWHEEDFGKVAESLYHKLVEKNELKQNEPLVIVDPGAGYGTFLHQLKEHLNAKGIPVRAIGINVRRMGRGTVRKVNGEEVVRHEPPFADGVEQKIGVVDKMDPDLTGKVHLLVSRRTHYYAKDLSSALEQSHNLLHPDGLAFIDLGLVDSFNTVNETDFKEMGMHAKAINPSGYLNSRLCVKFGKTKGFNPRLRLSVLSDLEGIPSFYYWK